MTRQALITIHDEVNATISNIGLNAMEKLKSHFTFYAPNYRFTPQYKKGYWDGRVSLVHSSGSTYLYIAQEAYNLLTSWGYDVVVDDRRKDWSDIVGNLEPIGEDYIKEESGILLRDYQVDSINRAISQTRGILDLATGAGKTYSSAAMAKYFSRFGRVVMIVDSTDLLINTYKAFESVNIDIGMWFQDTKEWKQVNIATWQSLKNAPELMDDAVCVMVDEIHRVKGNVIRDLLTIYGNNAPFRFGFTGTVPKDRLTQYTLFSMIGPVIKKISSKDLRDRGFLSNVAVMQVVMNDKVHRDLAEQMGKASDWNDEICILHQHECRNRALADLITKIRKTHGNVVVLMNRREHCRTMASLLECPIAYGDVSAKEREKYYQQFRDGELDTLVASYQVMSVGIDIPNMAAIVMVEPGRSFTRVVQTIGRVLRKHDSKDMAYAYDISTNSYKMVPKLDGTLMRKRSICYNQMYERRKIYREQEIPFDHMVYDYQCGEEES